ncbi:uncharacterized protein LY79DRAFT_274037 [Colletotrichum navitas]|uniref:Uncharacterized protein n=1 Tax=Colletotrichum navitas TaxID=681940 RepID=A0AAD8V1E6_9PEZI|nr:uncharacterized protein LY79DRAFT_274037 [Colletotrichum navitas]KAK1585231.1 hypothetical protein LY79DRAFT_274037 [Colletotrichum navitas]
MIFLHHMSDWQVLFRSHMFSMGMRTTLIDDHLRQFEQQLPTKPMAAPSMKRGADPSSPGSSRTPSPTTVPPPHLAADPLRPTPTAGRPSLVIMEERLPALGLACKYNPSAGALYALLGHTNDNRFLRGHFVMVLPSHDRTSRKEKRKDKKNAMPLTPAQVLIRGEYSSSCPVPPAESFHTLASLANRLVNTGVQSPWSSSAKADASDIRR